MPSPVTVNVPPARSADSTLINVPVHGSKMPSGVTGADQLIKCIATSVAAAQTNLVLDSFIAPFDGYIRAVSHFTEGLTGTVSFNLFDNTAAASILGATTPNTGTSAQVTSFTTPNFSAGDEIQLRCTTAAASSITGLKVTIFFTPLSGSTTNPL